MTDLILQQSEVLVFLDAVGADRLPGVETKRLIPQNAEERRSLLRQGIASLTTKGVLVVRDNTHVLPRNLVELFEHLTRPEVLTISQKDTPGLGRQTFLHIYANGRCVELTFPTETTYRFAEIHTAEDAIVRLLEIFPLQSEILPADGLQISVSDFMRLTVQAKGESQPDIAELIDQAVLAAELARSGVLDALRLPRFSGTLTVLQMKDAEAVNAHDFICLQGDHTAWLFELLENDPNQVRIQPVTPEICSQRFSDALSHLLIAV